MKSRPLENAVQPAPATNQPATQITALLNYVKGVFAVVDREGIIRFSSRSIAGLLQFEAEELLGRSCFGLLQGGYLSRERFRQLVAVSGSRLDGIQPMLNKNGSRVLVQIQIQNLLHDPAVGGLLIQLSPGEGYGNPAGGSVSMRNLIRTEIERELSAELHDHINPNLTAIKLLLAHAVDYPETSGSIISECAQTVAKVINDIRNISNALSPEQVDTICLSEALNLIAERYSKLKGLRLICRYHRGLDRLLSPIQKFHLFRLVQEQLVNIEKHAAATRATLSVQITDGELLMQTRDNGKGFNLEERTGGIGFANMRYRIQQLQGSMHVNSKSGEGTWIQLRFPLSQH